MDIELENLPKKSHNLLKTSKLVTSYGSLAENRLHHVRRQKKELPKREWSYRNETMVCSSSLKQIPQDFYEMAYSCKRAVLKSMSKELFFVYSVATLLPPAVVQSICLFMCDGNKDKAERFYTMPIGRAFDWYYENKKRLVDNIKQVNY